MSGIVKSNKRKAPSLILKLVKMPSWGILCETSEISQRAGNSSSHSNIHQMLSQVLLGY